MIIAVDTRRSEENDLNAVSDFIFSCFSVLAKQYPDHKFIYIFDAPYEQSLISSTNIIPVIIAPQTTSVLRLQYWHNYKVPAVLRKHKADVFVGVAGISLRTKIPQCLFLPDIGFITYPQFYKRSLLGYLNKSMPKFLDKARSVVTVSKAAQKTIEEQYSVDEKKIHVADKFSSPLFKKIGSEEREDTKQKFADGKEYFLYSGTIGADKNLLNILKAFSFFKKRQKSNIQLVIAGPLGKAYSKFEEDLRTFKFRDEVKVLPNLSKDESPALTGAAYAMLCPVFVDDLHAPVLESLRSGVPAIISKNIMFPEVCHSCVLVVDEDNFTDIANSMMLLFKDEDMRNAMGKAGMTLTAQFDVEKTAASLWKAITNINP
ncbi:MAG TPA: glycosyltransferase [Ferruginibacter sp.]|nr:glycosyltransferase [Ferruginibacter sp.]